MVRRIDISLDGLHQLLHRLERKELVDGDWAICAALVLQLITRMQGKQERMAAKLAANTAIARANVVEGQMTANAPSLTLPAANTISAAADHGTEVEESDAKKRRPKAMDEMARLRL